MVVFTCGHCGESVQKPKVEKHYLTKCRNRNPNLSCMDCFKDFIGQDYDSHTKCITEEERYSGKGFQAKEKKGERKQSTWVEMVQSVLEEQPNASSNVLRILETVSKYNNTPRKKPKFFNFVKNVCGNKTNPKDMEQAWDLIAVKLSALSNANKNQNQNKVQKETNNDGNKDNGIKENNTTIEEIVEEPKKTATNENGNEEENQDEVTNKKLSKKQRKEEKKRKKYEAELQSAEALAPEEEEEESNKKTKKKNSKSESSNADEETQGKNKKKRKRQDTANSVQDVPNESDNVENVEPIKDKDRQTDKASKKKLKVQEAEEEDSMCLHDQNVAKIEELTMNTEQKFNWHAVILCVLQKKGNELPFKRLQKKVLSEFSEATGQDVDDRIADKFIKKLKSAPNVRVDKNRVYILD